MKKWLILIAALVVLGGLFFASTLFTKEEKLGLCQQFIQYVRDNNPDAAYELFTPQAKGVSNIEGWREQAAQLRGAYYDPDNPALAQKSRTVTTTDDSGAEVSVTETYIIPSGESRYVGTCYLEKTDGIFLIDGYKSEANLDPADYKQEQS